MSCRRAWPWLLLLVAAALHADEERCPGVDPVALALLEDMARASAAVSYNGVLTLQRGDSLHMMNLHREIGDERVSEALTLLNGQAARVVRGGHPLDCEHPGHRQLLAAVRREGGCGLAAHYRLAAAPGARIAGRRAVRLILEPRDSYRHGYVFEVDRETALVLKGTTVAAGGRPLEQFQFASLALGPAAPAVPSELFMHRARHPHPAAEPRMTAEPGPAWRVGWVPAGFVPTDETRPDGPRRSYTDGMAAFSVFLEPLAEPLDAGEGVVREGSTVSYARGLRLDGEPVLVTVLGEIPVNTARMVADAVQAGGA